MMIVGMEAMNRVRVDPRVEPNRNSRVLSMESVSHKDGDVIPKRIVTMDRMRKTVVSILFFCNLIEPLSLKRRCENERSCQDQYAA